MSFKELRYWQLWVLKSNGWAIAFLMAILFLGLGLRFWHLDSKALWLDEVITALFSLGRSYADIPINQYVSTEHLEQIFTLRSGVRDAEIVQRLVADSTHPPLFFLLMYRWMNWLSPAGDRWVWALRSLPALFGVGAIAAVYALGRLAFTPTAALWSAAMMAVSPFAIYLSQEARHYTLPMLLVTLGLVGMMQIQQDLQRHYLRPWVWLGWAGVHVLGLYTHYFCAIALVAQVAALWGWQVWQRQKVSRRGWMALGLAIGGIGLAYLPWLPLLLGHADRPEVAWMRVPEPTLGNYIAPIYQTVVNWVLMVVILPVESQPLAIAVPMAMVMISFAVWVGWQAWRGLRTYWQLMPQHRSAIVGLAGFVVAVLLQFLGIVYLLGKDITVVPRYNFVYFPSVCVLLGVAFVGLSLPSLTTASTAATAPTDYPAGSTPFLPPQFLKRAASVPILILLVSLCSSGLVVHNLAFQKSFYPDRTARAMAIQPTQPLLLVANYQSSQDIALFLSIALELKKVYADRFDPDVLQFVFLSPEQGFEAQWRKLRQIPQPYNAPLHLWMLAPASIRTKQFPARLVVRSPQTLIPCTIVREHRYRMGFPYQYYTCPGDGRSPIPENSPR
ncbi:MAG TPA: glycosyltransferase family 39 protein [Synechococcales cyanobacterium M55_K2018_004]|nr:glycosyltransferase family 39 protein [Synechococcales cyanobacterium M55_K2018_004]